MDKKELYHNIFCNGIYNMIYDRVGSIFSVDETLNFHTDLVEIIANYNGLIEDIDSPIEKIMASGLFFVSNGYNRLTFCDYEDFLNNIKKLAEADKAHWCTYFASQVNIHNKYRVDFLLATICAGKVLITAIECDGHDYHERSKEQASRDKKRDRYLISKNIPTLRFTGSDIYNRYDECFEEIEAYLSEQTDKLLVEAGHIRGKNG